MAAKKEADAVHVIKEACMEDARRIAGEKGDAEQDLAQAKPFLEEAERAVESIKVPCAQRTVYKQIAPPRPLPRTCTIGTYTNNVSVFYVLYAKVPKYMECGTSRWQR